jgi:hypothetical protein
MIGLNRSESENSYKGPYIDYVSFSIFPMDENVIPVKDTVGGTPINDMQISSSDSKSATFGFHTSGSAIIDATRPTKPQYSLGGAFDFGVSASKTHTQSYSTAEYEQKEYIEAYRKTYTMYMSRCYMNDTPLPYDPKYIGSIGYLKPPSNAVGNLALTCVANIFQGLASYFEESYKQVYKPPNTSSSSIAVKWGLIYSTGERRNIRFEWITEVRTIFATYFTISNDLCKGLYWIKAVHRIKQVVEVVIRENNSIGYNVEPKEDKVVAIQGFDCENRIMRVITNNGTRVINEKDEADRVKEEFITPL